MRAKPSNKAIDHTKIILDPSGLIQIPVSVYTGTVSDHGIHRKQFVSVPLLDAAGQPVTRPKLDDNGAPVMVESSTDSGVLEPVLEPVYVDHAVGTKPYDKETGDDVENADIERKIPTESGFVYVTDEEVETLFELPPTSIRILAFQPQHLFFQGHYVPKALHYLVPAKVAKGRTRTESKDNQRAFAALLKGMREEGTIAVVEWVTRGLPKPAVMLPNGTLWSVYHTDALREQNELPDIEPSVPSVTMIRTFIQGQLVEEPLDLTDKRSELILNFAEEKAQAGDFTKPVEGEVGDVQMSEAPSDLEALLAATLAAQAASKAAEAEAVSQ